MVDEGNLSSVLRELGRTLGTEVPVQQILDQLVQRVVEVLPVTSAGVTLMGNGAVPRFVSASDEDALRYERLQTALGEGPSVGAFASGESVAMDDLSRDERFPAFTPAARAAGLGAAFSFPLPRAAQRLGALDLYRGTPGGLDQGALQAAQILADVAASFLVDSHARHEAQTAAPQPERVQRDGVDAPPGSLVDVEPLRVVVIDDEEPVRLLVRTVLERSVLATVVADTDGTPASVAAACEASPDVVLLDQSLGDRRGTELIGSIVRACPHAMVAILSGLDVDIEEGPALRAGAFSFYEKSAATVRSLPELLVEDHALYRRALQGEEVCAPSTSERRDWTAEVRAPHGPLDAEVRAPHGPLDASARSSETREQRLSRAFVDLADMLVGNFDVDDFLQLLCERIAEVLEVDAVGVMLESPGGVLRLWSASTEDSSAVELFEMQEREGPCHEAYMRGEQVSAPAITDEQGRWPAFTPRALNWGFTAAFGFPMHAHGQRIGAVNAFRHSPGDLDEHDRSAGQALADMAKLALLAHRRTEDAETLASQLQHALDTRTLIEQAKGVLAERCGITSREAWERMRQHARHERRTVRSLCDDIIAGDLTPSPASRSRDPEDQ